MTYEHDYDEQIWANYDIKVLKPYAYKKTLRDRYMMKDNGGLWFSFYVQYLLDMKVDYKYIFQLFIDCKDRLETHWDKCEDYSDGTVYLELSNSLMQYHFRADLKRLPPGQIPEIGHLPHQNYTAHTTLKIYTDIPYKYKTIIRFDEITDHITHIVGNTYRNLWDYSEYWNYSRNYTIEWDPVLFILHSSMYSEFIEIAHLFQSEKIRVVGPSFMPIKYLMFKYPDKMRYIFKLTEKCSPRSKSDSILYNYSFSEIISWISSDEWNINKLNIATEGCAGKMTFASSNVYSYLGEDPYYQLRDTFNYDLAQYNFSPLSYMGEFDIKNILNFIDIDMEKLIKNKNSSYYMGIEYTEQHTPFQKHTFKTRIHSNCIAIIGTYIILNPISLFDLVLFAYKYKIKPKNINIISTEKYNEFDLNAHQVVDNKTFINTVYDVLFNILRGE